MGSQLITLWHGKRLTGASIHMSLWTKRTTTILGLGESLISSTSRVTAISKSLMEVTKGTMLLSLLSTPSNIIGIRWATRRQWVTIEAWLDRRKMIPIGLRPLGKRRLSQGTGTEAPGSSCSALALILRNSVG